MSFIKSLVDAFFLHKGEELLNNIMPLALWAEHELTSLGINNIGELKSIFLDFGIALIVLKFLKKGFDTYILWTDGDPDADPLLLTTGFLKAIAIAYSFPVMYTWLVDSVNELSNKAFNAINLAPSTSLKEYIVEVYTVDIYYSLGILIFFIIIVFLYIQFIKKGLEIFIIRTGFPLACSGLMDSDAGVFKGYLQVLIQAALTVLVQVILAKLSLALIIGGNILWGIAAAVTAIKTPKMLDRFMVTSGGGGGGAINTAYSVSRLMQMIKK